MKHISMRQHYLQQPRIAIGTLAVLMLISLACGSTAAPASVDISGIQTAAVQTALAGVQVPRTPVGSPSTNAPPTERPPMPTETSMPEATPLTLSGSGDSIQDVSAWPHMPGLMIVEGNSGGWYFGVIPYDQQGNRLSSLVNTTDPYKGVTPFDFDGEYATRLDLKAMDAWNIKIVSLSQARQLPVPGTIEGGGDDVVVLSGATPDTATVTGNSGGRYFGIIAYGPDGSRLGSIVNTTDAYQGTVIVERNTAILEIKAIGNWSISVTAAP